MIRRRRCSQREDGSRCGDRFRRTLWERDYYLVHCCTVEGAQYASNVNESFADEDIHESFARVHLCSLVCQKCSGHHSRIEIQVDRLQSTQFLLADLRSQRRQSRKILASAWPHPLECAISGTTRVSDIILNGEPKP